MDQIAALAVQTDSCGNVGAQDATPSPKGESSVLLSLRMHHVAAHPVTLAHQLGLSRSEAIDAPELLHATKQLGLKAKLTRSYPQHLPLSPLHALPFMREPDFESISRPYTLRNCSGQPGHRLFQRPARGGSEAGNLPQHQIRHRARPGQCRRSERRETRLLYYPRNFSKWRYYLSSNGDLVESAASGSADNSCIGHSLGGVLVANDVNWRLSA